MSTATDILTGYQNLKGVKVYVKTNMSPRVLVYDSDAPNPQKSAPGLLDVGIMVEDRNGNSIASYGGYPKTDLLLTGAALAMLGAMVFFTVRGVIT